MKKEEALQEVRGFLNGKRDRALSDVDVAWYAVQCGTSPGDFQSYLLRELDEDERRTYLETLDHLV